MGSTQGRGPALWGAGQVARREDTLALWPIACSVRAGCTQDGVGGSKPWISLEIPSVPSATFHGLIQGQVLDLCSSLTREKGSVFAAPQPTFANDLGSFGGEQVCPGGVRNVICHRTEGLSGSRS